MRSIERGVPAGIAVNFGWQGEAVVLDDPEKTERLLRALQATLPCDVLLTPMLAKHLQSRAVAVDAN